MQKCLKSPNVPMELWLSSRKVDLGPQAILCGYVTKIWLLDLVRSERIWPGFKFDVVEILNFLSGEISQKPAFYSRIFFGTRWTLYSHILGLANIKNAGILDLLNGECRQRFVLRSRSFSRTRWTLCSYILGLVNVRNTKILSLSNGESR